MQSNADVEMLWLDDLDLPPGDSDLIRQARRRHAQRDAVNVDDWLTELAEHAQAKAAETKKAKGKHHGI